MDLPETSELQAFVQIADAGSVSGAAQELGLPRATVSRRLARLEERLGVRLMNRTTRRLSLTDSGEALYQHARPIVLAVSAASAAVVRDDGRPRGLLRLSVPPLANSSFRALLLSFVERYPEIELVVHSSTRHEGLVTGNIDVAWRAGQHIDPGLVARTLLRTELMAVASPDYLLRAGTPSEAADLASHACLLGFARGERPATHWPLVAGGQVRVSGKLVSNELSLLADAARRGLGIGLLPSPFIAADLENRTLVPVLKGVVGATSKMALVYLERRLLKPAIRAFVDFVVEWIEANPNWTAQD